MRHAPLLASMLFCAPLLAGCTTPPLLVQPDSPPSVRLTHAPLEDGAAYFYAYRMNWIGYDPDGRIDYFEYAIDPPADPAAVQWQQTRRNEQIVFFSAGRADESNLRSPATDFHTFAIRATDNDGLVSPVVTRSFFSYTVAPTVQITNPRPSSLLVASVSPSVRITWTGTDPDGQFTTRPVRYKYLLLGPSSDFPMRTAIIDPDSLRRYYAPTFAGWDSTPADSAWVQYTQLSPGVEYLFVVVAIDEAGAYSPIFSLNSNVLRMRAGYAGNLGPKLTIFNEYFSFTYASGGYVLDPSREIFIEVPDGSPVTFNWYATATAGASIVGYRWALDIADVSDDTPRSDADDVMHWSDLSLLTTSATVGPFTAPATHRFYVEARDDNGLRSLGVVRISVVEFRAERPLLIVDDTRFLADQFTGGPCPAPATGEWPSAAELDTFLFARGHVPWRCQNGAVTEPGLFAGYPFDTIGTRTGFNDATVRLSRLARYRHIVWLTDARGATFVRPGSDPFSPITSLRYMSEPGHFNTLSAYALQGGNVWLAGGGGAAATLSPWNSPINDGGGVRWGNSTGELIPGRFMYDFACWRSEIQSVRTTLFIQRNLGRIDLGSTWPGQPPYHNLPPAIRSKNASLDPLPVTRLGQPQSVFYKSAVAVEFLSLQNFCVEDVDPSPDRVEFQSVLDSLYTVVTFSLPPTTASRVCMTYSHGARGGPMMFTGFSLWDFTRADCQALVDFVLGDVWGLSRDPGAARPLSAAR